MGTRRTTTGKAAEFLLPDLCGRQQVFIAWQVRLETILCPTIEYF